MSDPVGNPEDRFSHNDPWKTIMIHWVRYFHFDCCPARLAGDPEDRFSHNDPWKTIMIHWVRYFHFDCCPARLAGDRSCHVTKRHYVYYTVKFLNFRTPTNFTGGPLMEGLPVPS